MAKHRRNLIAFSALPWARALLALAFLCSDHLAAAEEAKHYHIDASSLSEALRLFSEQSGLQTIYDSALLSGKRARPVDGEMTAEEVLRRLLAATDLEWLYANPTTIAVRRKSASAHQHSVDAIRDVPQTRTSDGVAVFSDVTVQRSPGVTL